MATFHNLLGIFLVIYSCNGDKISSKAPYLGDHLTIHIVGHTHDDTVYLLFYFCIISLNYIILSHLIKISGMVNHD